MHAAALDAGGRARHFLKSRTRNQQQQEQSCIMADDHGHQEPASGPHHDLNLKHPIVTEEQCMIVVGGWCLLFKWQADLPDTSSRQW